MQSKAPSLELHQKHAKVTIHTEAAKLEIDQSEAFSSAGLKNPMELAKDQTEMAYNYFLEYIAKTGADGDFLAAIELGVNAIAVLAEQSGYSEKEFGFVQIPKVGPKINYTQGYVWLEPGDSGSGPHNGVEGNYTPGNVNYNFTRGNVNIYLKQKAWIKMQYQENKVDISL